MYVYYIILYLLYIIRRNSAVTFGMEKLERCGYSTVKKVQPFRHNTGV